jgi:hypothetical protein
MTSEIVPAQGEESQVASALLALARSPYEVQTSTDNGLTFTVPNYLAELYAQSLQGPQNTEQDVPRRRPGRPRKESA